MSDKDDKLIRTYRNRRDEYQVPLRKDTWEKIEADLPSYRPAGTSLYRRIAIAAVFILMLCLSVPFLFRNDPPPVTHDPAQYDRSNELNIPQKPPQPNKNTLIYASASSVKRVADVNPVEEYTEEKRPHTILIDATVSDHMEKNDTTATGNTDPAKTQEVNVVKKENSILFPTGNKPYRKNRQPEWSFGLSAGINSERASSTLYYSNIFGEPGPPVTEPPPGETDKFTKYKYHHRLPLSIGLSVRKNITGHFALESGIVYTYLHSDISKEGLSGYIGEQKLHYIGIPLKLNWGFYTRGNLSAYLSAGTLFEYGISARQRNDRENLQGEFKRFQLSVNGAAGIQYRIVKPFSLFIEPGISYFFDHGQGIETIRTENPLMFNLQMGIRFNY